MKSGRRTWVTALLIGAVMVVGAVSPAAADQPDRSTNIVVDWENGFVPPPPPDVGSLSLLAVDPLGLLPGIDYLRTHSLGPDRIDVWTCGLGVDVNTVVAELYADVVPYFVSHSGGRYEVDFVPRGNATGTEQDCYDRAAANPSDGANGVLFAGPWAGGVATPGDNGPFFPQNDRWAFVGHQVAFSMVAAHELGHMLLWPHSSTGTSGDDYDNALDLMSGNYGVRGDTYPLPYATAVINRYAAGWIDPQEVAVLGPAAQTVRLGSPPGGGTQMAVIRSGDLYYTLGGRTSSTYDPIPGEWEGVEVYEVNPCPEDEANVVYCFLDQRYEMGFRQTTPWGKKPFAPGSRPGNVIPAGSSATVGGRAVTVTGAGEGTFDVSVGPGAPFTDTSGHVFGQDIQWLGASGITRGCNPPTNSLFCPEDPVTRGQMAAFLHRALPDLTTGSATDFGDDNGTVFESDIEWLSATGVTRGCNPPANDRFCPDEIVTRAQMAAFLHRALPGLTAGSATDFRDDNGNVFEADIEWLAATGVTRGCNPPANDRFCPASPVTRGAMAAFLHRALEG